MGTKTKTPEPEDELWTDLIRGMHEGDAKNLVLALSLLDYTLGELRDAVKKIAEQTRSKPHTRAVRRR